MGGWSSKNKPDGELGAKLRFAFISLSFCRALPYYRLSAKGAQGKALLKKSTFL
jgi:hypothetical protein